MTTQPAAVVEVAERIVYSDEDRTLHAWTVMPGRPEQGSDG